MQGRDKAKSVSHRRNQDKNLPSLKSSTLISKAIIALSKVDIDSRNIHRDQPIRSTAPSEKVEKEREHMRSQSGFNIRKPKQLPPDTKMLTKTQFEMQNPSQFKLALKDIKQEEQAPALSQVVIDKAKISSKSYGIVKAYSANSHAGPLMSYNEDRICIVTNLTKTNIKQKQVSFFGVYDGSDGIARVDYLRDNFHLSLAQEQSFPNDMELALRSTLRKVSKAFVEDPRFNGDQSSVGFYYKLYQGEQIHYIQTGNCKSVFSSNLGSSIFFPSKTETAMLTKQATKKSRSVGELIRKSKAKDPVEVQYRKYTRNERLDFVLLGSEGMFENMKIREIGRKIWQHILKNKEECVHFAVGQANNQILSDVFTSLSTKNTSLIIIAFEALLQCLEGSEMREELTLPNMARTQNQ